MNLPSKENVKELLAAVRTDSDPFEKDYLLLNKAATFFMDGTVFSEKGHIVCRYEIGEGKLAHQLYIDEVLVAHREENLISFSEEIRAEKHPGKYHMDVACFICLDYNLDISEALAAENGLPIIPERNETNWNTMLKKARQLQNDGRLMNVVTAVPGTYDHFLEVLPPMHFDSNSVLCSEPSHADPITGAMSYSAVFKNEKGTEFYQYCTRVAFKNFDRRWLPKF